MGLGNPMFGDDGCGVRLAEIVAQRVASSSSMLSVIVAGISPERHLAASCAHDTVVFADAVECGQTPGTVILMAGDQIVARYPQVSTHKLSLGLLAKRLADAGVKTWLLGIQPGSMAPGAALTREVAASVDSLACVLADAGREADA